MSDSSRQLGRLKRAAPFLLALVAAGCSTFGACTLIGCVGLMIEVSNAPANTPITVVVTAADQSTTSKTQTCAGNTVCPFSFPDFTPASMTIKVTAGSQTKEITAQPTYSVTRPNGEDCPPECRTATVPVALQITPGL